MNRQEIHDWIDAWLDKWGFEEKVTLPWGSLLFKIQYGDGNVVMKETERRETER